MSDDLKDPSIRVLVENGTLTEEDVREFREIFNLVDTDRGGSISPDELAKLMDTLRIPTTADELRIMVAEIDENGNGEIDFGEFVQVMSRKVNADCTPDEVKRAFKVFSSDAPGGLIRVADLEAALMQYGRDRLTPEEAHHLVAQLEVENGFFNFSEYVDVMMGTSNNK